MRLKEVERRLHAAHDLVLQLHLVRVRVRVRARDRVRVRFRLTFTVRIRVRVRVGARARVRGKASTLTLALTLTLPLPLTLPCVAYLVHAHHLLGLESNLDDLGGGRGHDCGVDALGQHLRHAVVPLLLLCLEPVALPQLPEPTHVADDGSLRRVRVRARVRVRVRVVSVVASRGMASTVIASVGPAPV